MYLNKAIIIGNLTRDPEQRALPSGVTVTSFSVATSRVWKDKNGVRQEDSQFHNVVAFGPQANIAGQYLRKGSSVMVEGRMQTRSWDAQDGSKKYRTEIVVEKLQLGPRRDGQGGEGGAFQNTQAASAAHSPEPQPPLDTIDYPDEDINPDDIPF